MTASVTVRIGLNSGRVVAGEIGSGVKVTVRSARRRVCAADGSVAPHGGVMLVEATALFVEHAAVVKEPSWCASRGPTSRCRCASWWRSGRGTVVGRADASLVGRNWEMAVLDAMVDRAIGGRGDVVNVVGPPGIGKSRVSREAAALAAGRGVDVLGPSANPMPATFPSRSWRGCCGRAWAWQTLTAGRPGPAAAEFPRRPAGSAAAR